ncbi:FliI/YscN family ATPase [Jannaschia ovalis]|uniref:FliI/YscN family ATPase n=1 Tax=Jannaschia ovalis TaxID=3038773 RepID=A0ABY8LFW4_9RHOB|nr:FliI/YscN family ATPase [Jannaschia sp. GRR-S6-38]WGH80184.1 FliI/YscN family ATPase [Jannaschia sp. GRR-S6-38]
MTQNAADPFATLRQRLAGIRTAVPIGRINALDAAGFEVGGLSRHARLGDDLVYEDESGGRHHAEIVRIDPAGLRATPFGQATGLRVGQAAWPGGAPQIAPGDDWIGRVLDPFGRPLDDGPVPDGVPRPLHARPQAATRRRGMGPRLHTGHAVIDTVLPLAAGQRIGLFAGSGIGKSTLLAAMARQIEADICVLALVGERGREVAEFTSRALGPEGMARSVVIAATADQPASLRRRCAITAMAAAEHFRDRGRRVLFLCDSVTRLAEAHREVAAAAGEPCDLRGHPASLTPLLAGLTERAGPGGDGQGDITAIFSVLVAGSDMEEPVADILRGQLDGHVVLSRDIAEAGRFPAVDVLRSVSRCLPGVASAEENAIIGEVRRLLSIHDRNALMVRSGLYERGSSAEIDRTLAIVPRLEAVFAQTDLPTVEEAFRQLAGPLGLPYRAPDREGHPPG